MSFIQDDNPILTKKEWLDPSRYHTGRIIEYDIKSANINVLYNIGTIDGDMYQKLNSVPKQDREVAVGKMIAEDKTLYDALMKGILRFRKELVRSNNIQEEEVVRVATDAIYVNRFDDLRYTEFGNVKFVQKTISSNMVALLDLLVFSNYTNNNIDIDVKGLGKSVEYHQQYMLSLIANVIYMFERVSIVDALNYLTHMYEQYVNLQLPIGFYRQLNPASGYMIKNTDFEVPGKFGLMVYDVSDISAVDIGYNISYLRELHNIIFENFH